MNTRFFRTGVMLLFGAALLFAFWGFSHLHTRAAQPLAEVSACGSITTNTLWTSDNLYLAANCSIIIETGATLTIQPGTTVKFLGGQAVLIVRGTLNAQGSAAQPITFSSVNDDQHGQTAAASTSNPAAEDWYGIYFASGSNSQMSHAFIGYGTANTAPPIVGWNQAQLYVESAALSLDTVEIAYGTRPGIYLAGNSDSVSITNTSIHHHSGAQSYPYSTAIYQGNLNTQPTYQNLTFTNNDHNEITLELNGSVVSITRDLALAAEDYGMLCGYTTCILDIPNGLTLTMAPGAQLDLRASYGIQISAGGSLWAQGTPVSPITFTSHLAAAGANQYWAGIWAQPGSALTLSHCDISYAYGRNGNAALEIEADGAQVSDCHIHHNSSSGIFLQSLNATQINVTLNNVRSTDNARMGAHLGASGGGVIQLTWHGGELSRNGWSGMWGYTNASSIYPNLSNLTVAENGATGDFDERRGGLYFNYNGIFPTLENITLTDNIGAAALWTCSGSSLTAINLTASGNGEDTLQIPGCTIYTGSQWNLAQVGVPVRIAGNLYVVDGGFLTIEPGSTLHFDRPDGVTPIAMYIQNGGAFYALGTPTSPITFTGFVEQPGWWGGIDFYNPSAVVLRYAHVAYGGGGNFQGQVSLYRASESAAPLRIENNQIHHSARWGVHFDSFGVAQAQPPIVRGNHLHNNAEGGILNWDADRLDARQNYWGDPSGPYHATQNPTGLGEAISDNILFYPWLTEPDSGGTTPGEVLLTTGAPPAISPGQATEYTLQYLNLMTETVQNAVLMLQLPRGTEYLESTDNGIYWVENHQVFWKLGDIPAGAQNFLTVRVRFNWGLPSNYRAGSIAFLVGENYNVGAFDRTPYLEYQPVTVTQITLMTQAEFDVLRIANADLQTLYQQAINEGYTYLESGTVTYSNGQVVHGVAMRTANRQYIRLLTLFEGQALATTSGGGVFTLHNTTGGMVENLQTHERTFLGDWIPPEGDARAPNTCTATKCKIHCIGKSLSIEVIGGAVAKTFFWTISTGGTGGLLSGGYQVYKITRMVLDCRNGCDTNPYTGCCDAEGQIRWSQGILPGYCGKAYCNATTGTWGMPGQLRCEGRCVALLESQGGGCKDCGDAQIFFSRVETVVEGCAQIGAGSCTDTGLVVARDPNAIYGPMDDLLPGDLVTYTITYENEGDGRAYGVYVASTLPDVFNAATLTFVYGDGSYLPESRELLWWVGELGPKGNPDSEGVITYTVQLTNGLPSGTLVANQAIVYFSSVPEETPTNLWLNRVAPLVAESQRVQTNYTAPVSVTLGGRDISGLPLTFEIVESPRAGILSGTAPNLTYTPFENFSGYDGFTFKVSNGITESTPADVWVAVQPIGDVQPPLLVWSNPADEAVDVAIAAAPLFTDTLGGLYAPALTLGFSEAVLESSVTTASVTLSQGGAAVTLWLRLSDDGRQIVAYARSPLLPGKTYTLTLSSALTDLAGNPLAPVNITFTTAAAQPGNKIYLPLVMR